MYKDIRTLHMMRKSALHDIFLLTKNYFLVVFRIFVLGYYYYTKIFTLHICPFKSHLRYQHLSFSFPHTFSCDLDIIMF